MTVSINGYTVDIKAKYGTSADKRMNKGDTMAVLNLLSIWASEAADMMDMNGCHAIAKVARDAGRGIYLLLDSKGLYDNIKI